jgi:hypothetical protein
MNTVADTLMSSESVEAAPVETPAPAPEKPKATAKKAKPTETLEEVVAKATEAEPVEIQVEGGDDILAELDGLDDLTFDD